MTRQRTNLSPMRVPFPSPAEAMDGSVVISTIPSLPVMVFAFTRPTGANHGNMERQILSSHSLPVHHLVRFSIPFPLLPLPMGGQWGAAALYFIRRTVGPRGLSG